jgi:hypothetical protein
MHDACRSISYFAMLYTEALIVLLMSPNGTTALFSCPQTMWLQLLGHILWK